MTMMMMKTAIQRVVPRIGRTTASKHHPLGTARSSFLSNRGMASSSTTTDASSSSSDYYYDSQSGQHVPVHNENHVSVFLELESSFDWSTIDREEWQASGIRGVVVPHKNASNLPEPEILSNVTGRHAEDFRFFLPIMSSAFKSPSQEITFPKKNNVVSVLAFRQGHEESLKEAFASLQENVDTTTSSNDAARRPETAILLDGSNSGGEGGADESSGGGDAMLTATAVAEILDSIPGAGDYILLSGDRLNRGNDIVELAEELTYLDVTGPTMKSRLVVNLSNNMNQDAEETLDDCLAMGINKFVIDEERLKWVGHHVRDVAGKECNVWSM